MVNFIVGLMNGVVIVKRINKIDIMNIVVLVNLLIIFNVESFFVDKYKKVRNIISEIIVIIWIDIVFMIFLFFWIV